MIHEQCQITVFHIPGTPFAKSFVGFRGWFTPDEAGIGGKSFDLRIHSPFERHTGTNHHHQHEYTPENPEGSHHTPRFIVGDGNPDFLESVYVK
jgi:hypothetical protein